MTFAPAFFFSGMWLGAFHSFCERKANLFRLNHSSSGLTLQYCDNYDHNQRGKAFI